MEAHVCGFVFFEKRRELFRVKKLDLAMAALMENGAEPLLPPKTTKGSDSEDREENSVVCEGSQDATDEDSSHRPSAAPSEGGFTVRQSTTELLSFFDGLEVSSSPSQNATHLLSVCVEASSFCRSPSGSFCVFLTSSRGSRLRQSSLAAVCALGSVRLTKDESREARVAKRSTKALNFAFAFSGASRISQLLQTFTSLSFPTDTVSGDAREFVSLALWPSADVDVQYLLVRAFCFGFLLLKPETPLRETRPAPSVEQSQSWLSFLVEVSLAFFGGSSLRRTQGKLLLIELLDHLDVLNGKSSSPRESGALRMGDLLTSQDRRVACVQTLCSSFAWLTTCVEMDLKSSGPQRRGDWPWDTREFWPSFLCGPSRRCCSPRFPMRARAKSSTTAFVEKVRTLQSLLLSKVLLLTRQLSAFARCLCLPDMNLFLPFAVFGEIKRAGESCPEVR